MGASLALRPAHPIRPLPFSQIRMAGPHRAYPGGYRYPATRLGIWASARAGDTPVPGEEIRGYLHEVHGLWPYPPPPSGPALAGTSAGSREQGQGPKSPSPPAARLRGARVVLAFAAGSSRWWGRSRTARNGRLRELGGSTTEKMKAPSEKMVAFQCFSILERSA